MRHGVVTKVNFQVKSSQELRSLSKYHWTECAKMTFLAFAGLWCGIFSSDSGSLAKALLTNVQP